MASFFQTEGKKKKSGLLVEHLGIVIHNSLDTSYKSMTMSSETAFLTVSSKYVYRYTAPFLQTEGKKRNSGLLVERLWIFFLTILQMEHLGRRGVIVGNLQSRP